MEKKEIDPNIFRSYDVRGTYPKEINKETAYRIGQAFVKYVQPKGKIVVGYDVRTSSPELHQAVIKGVTDAGVDAVDIGLASTEMYYFAVGNYKYAGGIMVTASHQPVEFNGFKMVKEAVYPIFGDEGMSQIKELILNNQDVCQVEKKGTVERKAVMADFADFVLTMIDKNKLKPLKVVGNPNFGYQGIAIKYIIDRAKLPVTFVGINDEPDGTFPKGDPNPMLTENRVEFLKLCAAEKADFGVTWDADGDRVFFATGSGIFVDPYYTNYLLVKDIFEKSSDKTLVYEPRYTWLFLDVAKEFGGKAVPEKVGHSFIKSRMKKENAVFSGECSGHTYFRDFWYADSGIIPLLKILELVSRSDKTFEELVTPAMNKYPVSGEINSSVENQQGKIVEIKAKYTDAEVSELDGLTIEYPEWRANIRPSANDPFLRLNVEAKSKAVMEEKRDELLAIIRSEYKSDNVQTGVTANQI